MIIWYFVRINTSLRRKITETKEGRYEFNANSILFIFCLKKTHIPEGSPLGADARNIPLLVHRSTSTVGMPRLSRICLAFIFVITEETVFRIWLDCASSTISNYNDSPGLNSAYKGHREKNYNEENGIGSLGPDGGIDGVLNLTREHVLVQVLLHWHFELLLRFTDLRGRRKDEYQRLSLIQREKSQLTVVTPDRGEKTVEQTSC